MKKISKNYYCINGKIHLFKLYPKEKRKAGERFICDQRDKSERTRHVIGGLHSCDGLLSSVGYISVPIWCYIWAVTRGNFYFKRRKYKLKTHN